MTARSIRSWRLAEGLATCVQAPVARLDAPDPVRWLIKSCCVLPRMRVGRPETPALARLLHGASRYGFDRRLGLSSWLNVRVVER
jgi:hypothetical protein